MVFEEAHCIDPTSRAALDIIIDRPPALRVLAIVTFRPEFTPAQDWSPTSHDSNYSRISERWLKSVRTGCLDHLLLFSEAHLHRAIPGYATYFNYWRSHRSFGQRAPCDSAVHQFRPRGANCKITAAPGMGGFHHIYRRAV